MPLQWLVIKTCEKVAYKEKMCTSHRYKIIKWVAVFKAILILSWKYVVLCVVARARTSTGIVSCHSIYEHSSRTIL